MPCGRCNRSRPAIPPRPAAAIRNTPMRPVNPANPTQHLGLLPASEFVQLDDARREVERKRREAIRKSLGVG